MSSGKAAVSAIPEVRLLTRVLDEGYGPGAWHGPDLKAALADVSPELAFWRPSPERHNLAEVALHHAGLAANPGGRGKRAKQAGSRGRGHRRGTHALRPFRS